MSGTFSCNKMIYFSLFVKYEMPFFFFLILLSNENNDFRICLCLSPEKLFDSGVVGVFFSCALYMYRKCLIFTCLWAYLAPKRASQWRLCMQICPVMGSYIYFLSFPMALFLTFFFSFFFFSGYTVSKEGLGCVLREPCISGWISLGFVCVFGLGAGGMFFT